MYSNRYHDIILYLCIYCANITSKKTPSPVLPCLAPRHCRCTSTTSGSSLLLKNLSKLKAIPKKTKKNSNVTTPGVTTPTLAA